MKQHNTGYSGFLIHIEGTENATWQGTVTMADTGKQETFRSALELIRLIDRVGTEKGAGSLCRPGKIDGQNHHAERRYPGEKVTE